MHHVWESMDGGIGRMRVDPWTLENCIHIPEAMWDRFAGADGEAPLRAGESHGVELEINGQTYQARLYLKDRAEPNRREMELRYDDNHELQHVLNSIFRSSAAWIFQARIGKPLGMSVTVPDALAEYLEFYPTGQPFRYRLAYKTQAQQPHRSDPVEDGILHGGISWS